MNRTARKRRLTSRGLAAAGTAVAAFAVIVTVVAQASDGFSLSAQAISGGGGRSSLGATVIEGSIGQPFAARSSSGSFAVSAGILEGGPVKFSRRVPYVANDGLSPN